MISLIFMLADLRLDKAGAFSRLFVDDWFEKIILPEVFSLTLFPSSWTTVLVRTVMPSVRENPLTTEELSKTNIDGENQ